MKIMMLRLLALCLAAGSIEAAPLGTAFSYQGFLSGAGAPSTGTFDFQFSLYDAANNGNQIGPILTNIGVAVNNGLFLTTLDFSNVFDGNARWLALGVRTNGGGGAFTALTPLQMLAPTPYSLFATDSGGSSNVAGGSISAAQLNTTGTAPVAGQVLAYNGTNLVWTNASGGGGSGGNAWSLTGNSGTSPASGDFLGTTDNNPLEFHIDGMRALRLAPSSDAPNVIGGAPGNFVASGMVGATIGGGGTITLYGAAYTNSVYAYHGTIGGGLGNTIQTSSYESTIAGGNQNTIQPGAYRSSIGGGYLNMVQSNAYESVIGGGSGNQAGAVGATVPGGLNNSANGPGSFAAGVNAHAPYPGNFVWGDGTQAANGTGSNRFDVLATGGVNFFTSGSGLRVDGVLVSGGGGGSGSGWSLTGNAGTTPGPDFLGTTDDVGLELHVNGLRGLRLDYAATSTTLPSTTTDSVNVNAGCWQNTISPGVYGGTIAGGGYRFISGFEFFSFSNAVIGNLGTVGGGAGNTAGPSATVPGGYNNSATGVGSFAAGANAHTDYGGNFVWGDGTQAANGTGSNRFDVLATGGVNFFTSTVNMATKGGGMFVGNGKTGINTTTPSQALEVNGEFILVDGASGIQCYIGDDGSGNDVQIGSLQSGITAVSCYNETDNAYMHLYCSSVTIEGGADLAEPFNISNAEKDIAQGSVVVIDEQNPGQLKLSDQAYDTRVAGVVSGANGINPGIQMEQQGVLEGGKNVALTGRVYVQADASGGAIRPGDLLTTSATPGHAMRVSDHAKAQGAILGKAMTGLSEGKGMVLVLVTLQ